MNRRAYLALALTMPRAWLEACAADPSPHMRPIHAALCRIALRRKSARA